MNVSQEGLIKSRVVNAVIGQNDHAVSSSLLTRTLLGFDKGSHRVFESSSRRVVESSRILAIPLMIIRRRLDAS